MPRKKRAHTGNLRVLAQKKARLESDNEAEMPSSSQMEEQSDHQFEWETGDIGDVGEEGGAVEMESESILSEMSEDEDVPTLDAAGLSAFLQKAADGLQEFIRRGSSAAMRGAKATYAVKIGQQQSRHTENRNKQKLLEAHREGIEGGNKITRWFHKKSAPGHEPPAQCQYFSVSYL
jgi:hypothetical protein